VAGLNYSKTGVYFFLSIFNPRSVRGHLYSFLVKSSRIFFMVILVLTLYLSLSLLPPRFYKQIPQIQYSHDNLLLGNMSRDFLSPPAFFDYYSISSMNGFEFAALFEFESHLAPWNPGGSKLSLQD
jgi:hypothetical protein